MLLAEKGYDYTVCPYGLSAAVGCSAMLSLSEDDIKEGDVVILAVEPTDETMSSYFRASAFLKCAEALRVYVPAAAYPMYRDGFGCEANPWTEHLDRVYPY